MLNATIFRTVTLALVHFMADYCAPVWCRGAHSRLINKPIDDALRIMTECLRPTPTDNLFILAGIQPTKLSRQKALLSLARRAQKSGTDVPRWAYKWSMEGKKTPLDFIHLLMMLAQRQ